MSALLGLCDIGRLLPRLKLPGADSDSGQLSASQTRALEKKGIEPKHFRARAARQLLAHLAGRKQAGLCTLRQAAALEKFGVANPTDILLQDVEDRLAQARREMLPVRIEKYLQKCEPAFSGQFGHNATFSIALVLVRGFCLTQEEALPFLRQYNQRCEPPWNEEELKYKLASAANFKPSQKDFPAPGYLLNGDESPLSSETAATPQPVHKPKARYEPEYLESYAQALSDTVDEAYLQIRSQFTCWNRSPAGFLHKIFRPGESVWVTTDDKSSEGLVWTHDGLTQNLGEIDGMRRGWPNVWFLSNPIDGRLHQAERLKSTHNPNGESFRCCECVSDWRHGVLETDVAPFDLWLKALVLLELPILAIYHSCNRGLHALFRLGATSPDHWNELLEPHRRNLIRLGACPGTLSPLRLTRLPNCIRGQTGNLQKLLYLAPDADSIPICQRPPREKPLAVHRRWLEAHRDAD